MAILSTPVELTDAELDAVAAGAGQGDEQAAGVAQAGLINAGVIVQVQDVLSHNNVNVVAPITL